MPGAIGWVEWQVDEDSTVDAPFLSILERSLEFEGSVKKWCKDGEHMEFYMVTKHHVEGEQTSVHSTLKEKTPKTNDKTCV